MSNTHFNSLPLEEQIPILSAEVSRGINFIDMPIPTIDAPESARGPVGPSSTSSVAEKEAPVFIDLTLDDDDEEVATSQDRRKTVIDLTLDEDDEEEAAVQANTAPESDTSEPDYMGLSKEMFENMCLVAQWTYGDKTPAHFLPAVEQQQRRPAPRSIRKVDTPLSAVNKNRVAKVPTRDRSVPTGTLPPPPRQNDNRRGNAEQMASPRWATMNAQAAHFHRLATVPYWQMMAPQNVGARCWTGAGAPSTWPTMPRR